MDIQVLQQMTRRSRQAYENICSEPQTGQFPAQEINRAVEFRAQTIITKIRELTTHAAQVGETHALIMRLSCDDYQKPDPSYLKVEPEWLRGAGQAVYEYCTQKGLNPTIEYGYDWARGQSSYSIIVNWNDTPT